MIPDKIYANISLISLSILRIEPNKSTKKNKKVRDKNAVSNANTQLDNPNNFFSFVSIF